MSRAVIPFTTMTCKKGGFWSQEIENDRAPNTVEGATKECCLLLKDDPLNTPEFCPPTVTWCKFQANNVWDSDIKEKCCDNFGDDMPQCSDSRLMNMPAELVNNTIPLTGTFHINGDSEYAIRNLTVYSENIPTLTPDLMELPAELVNNIIP